VKPGAWDLTSDAPVAATAAMGPLEFVAFIALSLVVGAMATDLMLPALSAITRDLALAQPNLSQSAIAAFLLGMGAPQLLFGPISDRYGRRPVFLWGLAVFVVGGVLSALAPDLATLVAARLLQGFGAGAQRVVTFSIVRDRHGGVEMARIMSLAMTILLLEPIVAPMLGQLILLAGAWRWIPVTVALAGSALLTWALLRLEESLPTPARRSIAPAAVFAAYREVLTNRPALAHMLAFGLVMGAHFGFLSSAQAVFQQTYGVGLRFTLLLALVSLAMASAAFLNARLVRIHGSARLIRRAFQGVVLINGLAATAAAAGQVALPEFLAIQTCNMFAFGLLAPNLTAQSMSPLGHVAGTAASMFGFLTTTFGAVLGFAIGQLFDGTVRPVLCAYAIFGFAALLILGRAGRLGTSSVLPSTGGS
jgi:DHA1 family bicyclomycin/chloramphenicol resistance-like MFS transporter